MDPYEQLGISKNPDGSLNRPFISPISPPCSSPNSNVLALSKDITLNTTNNTWLRLFLPKPPLTDNRKLPIIVYFHGSGFVLASAASTMMHEICVLRAAKIPALVISVEYRLAPEHRLPAAYDDAVEALIWVRDQVLSQSAAEAWMRDYADFSKCYLMGTSAGANIAYHCGLRSLDLDIAPLRISGLILNQPYFSGVIKTESEERSVEDKAFPLAMNHALWELSLPIGADRDHEYSNPAVKTVEKAAKGLGTRYLVKGYVGDPLLDRARAFAEELEREGVSVVALLEEEGFHGVDLANSDKAEAFAAEITSFIYDCN